VLTSACGERGTRGEVPRLAELRSLRNDTSRWETGDCTMSHCGRVRKWSSDESFRSAAVFHRIVGFGVTRRGVLGALVLKSTSSAKRGRERKRHRCSRAHAASAAHEERFLDSLNCARFGMTPRLFVCVTIWRSTAFETRVGLRRKNRDCVANFAHEERFLDSLNCARFGMTRHLFGSRSS
jgi:hypothetical protein